MKIKTWISQLDGYKCKCVCELFFSLNKIQILLVKTLHDMKDKGLHTKKKLRVKHNHVVLPIMVSNAEAVHTECEI